MEQAHLEDVVATFLEIKLFPITELVWERLGRDDDIAAQVLQAESLQFQPLQALLVCKLLLSDPYI